MPFKITIHNQQSDEYDLEFFSHMVSRYNIVNDIVDFLDTNRITFKSRRWFQFCYITPIW